MTTKTAEVAQRELLQLLEAVKEGEEVLVEHHGSSFRLTLVPPVPPHEGLSPLVVEDPEVLAGNWTWTTDDEGRLQFQARREHP